VELVPVPFVLEQCSGVAEIGQAPSRRGIFPQPVELCLPETIYATSSNKFAEKTRTGLPDEHVLAK
jgi:hypothetical protein